MHYLSGLFKVCNFQCPGGLFPFQHETQIVWRLWATHNSKRVQLACLSHGHSFELVLKFCL